MSNYSAMEVDQGSVANSGSAYGRYNAYQYSTRTYSVKRSRTSSNPHGRDYDKHAHLLSQQLNGAVNLVIPFVRKAVDRAYELEPFEEFPEWVQTFQDALEESWRLIERGGKQSAVKFAWDGGHMTIFLLAASVDPTTYDQFTTLYNRCSPSRIEYVSDLIHKVKSVPQGSGTYVNIWRTEGNKREDQFTQDNEQ